MLGVIYMEKQLLKTIKTKNHVVALRIFRKYNSSQFPENYATITKQKGGDNTLLYIVKIYELIK